MHLCYFFGVGGPIFLLQFCENPQIISLDKSYEALQLQLIILEKMEHRLQ